MAGDQKSKSRAANGEGTKPVQRADGRWYSRVTYYNALGERKRKDIYGKTSSECVKNKRKFLADQVAGLPVNVGAQETVTQYVTAWLSARRDLAERTAEGYRSYLRKHIEKSKLGGKRLVDVQPGDLRAFMAMLADKGLAGGTIRRIMSLLGGAFGVAASDGTIARNAVSLVKLPPASAPHIETLTPTQVRKLWELVKNHKLSALFVLAVAIACRQGELLALRWSEVVLDGPNPQLKIVSSLSYINGKGFVFGPPKSKSGIRTIPLGKDQIAILKAHKIRQNTVRLQVGDLWQDNDLVFCTMRTEPHKSYGKPLDRRNVFRSWKRLLKGSGLPDITFHALRHTALTEMAAAEINPETIRQIAGHSDVRITLAWYTHPTQEMKRQAIDRLNDRYTNAPDEPAAEGENTLDADGTEGQ